MELPLSWWIMSGLVVTVLLSILFNMSLIKQLGKIQSQLKSVYTKHGLMAEQFLPFSKLFPGDPRNFRFLGSPVDGISFEDDKVLIFEFKTGKSRLSPKQEHIKDLIRNGKVFFKEVRV
ncbi:MAG: endonuclease [Chloroflexi bacterium]|nr:endonuclease [Chloroflexota bacterium]|tara:strand:- start:420 stop:776 length:357 start_codon:yes stop_codon:yes gene_type:complete